MEDCRILNFDDRCCLRVCIFMDFVHFWILMFVDKFELIFECSLLI
ncbi:hypothetical protein M6B38_393095 [Iris pallida]|uniref:Uncharacterized protein n=1 Tax=Iris pallida TaxID=29817 RepID=A0AAX6DHB1_IRIPA|nr:hypothetical protein M6B38_245710 [Iris pallida]KAJ6821388.1 hypothetical protein M6B38_393095 [Iris pallida]